MSVQCTRGYGIDEMYKQLYDSHTSLIMIGPICSNVAQPVNEAAILWNITSVGSTE